MAAALVATPPVIFLDEPTTGLDPRSRLDLWKTIDELVTNGSTVLLATQYMEEAEQLADDIVVNDPADLAAAELALTSWAVGDVHIDGRSVNAPVVGGADTLRDVLAELSASGVPLLDVGLRRPTLDDVFLTLTGSAPAGDAVSATGNDDIPPADQRELEVAR